MENKIEKIYEIEQNNAYYPSSLLSLQDPPKKLYVIGNIELINNKKIAIVGSRINTEYGEINTKKFAYQLSKKGLTIVSGLAEGIDTIAHQNSMRNKGGTIAVVASGFKNIFPKKNKNLFKNIIKNNGCIISEYSPETKVNMKNFPIRNRIIAGLSLGVLVTEAKFRSGSSITAKRALELGKPVFCLPNKIGEVNGVGTNNLIKIGAHLVTDVNEILVQVGEELIGEKEKMKINEMLEKETKYMNKSKEKVKKYKTLKIDKQYIEIYKSLIEKPLNIEELARKTNKSIAEINQKITIMEIEGLIQTYPGNIIKLKE